MAKQATSESEGVKHPAWLAMGAAFVGTLLGGGAVWLGISQQLEQLEARRTAAESGLQGAGEAKVEFTDATAGSPESLPDTTESPILEGAQLEGDVAGAGVRGAEAGGEPGADPGDSELVRAIEATRDSVVTLALAGGAAGSGVIYDDSGTLLTNYHVIEPALRASALLSEATASSIVVRFVDGRERGAQVLAADPDEDIAILAIEAAKDERFSASPLGRSAGLRLGEQVFAIGSPVGFEGTVATGIISALQRTGVLANRQLPVLQLDAAINFGNSGGPLFNLAGEIVGITTARSSRGEGIGFAIPIDRIRLFLQALEQGVGGRSGVIGVSLEPGREIAKAVEALGYRSGVLVSSVEAQGTAARAGMVKGDIVVSLRGRRHDELDASPWGRASFARLVGETIRGLIPGERLVVEVVRDGQLVELELEVEAASSERQARIDTEVLLGLMLDEDEQHPQVRSLSAGAPIARMRGAEILAGAKIIKVSGHSVATVEELGERLAQLRSWGAGRGGRSIAIEFELSDGTSLRARSFPFADAM